MARILVDANVFLGFWKVRSGRLQSELLPAVLELTSEILITSQLKDEIARNRLSVFLNEAKFENLTTPPVLPGHLLQGAAAEQWNKDHKLAIKSLERLRKNDWQTVLITLAKDIVAGIDPVSQKLKPLLDTAQTHSSEQLHRARDRRERGNPPGKKSDPLGDQLTWEQFLDSAGNQRCVWIVSRDSDYVECIDGNVLLNPFLVDDLTRRANVTEVRAFDNLARAVADIKSSGIIVKTSPSKERLKELGKALSSPPARLLSALAQNRLCASCGSDELMCMPIDIGNGKVGMHMMCRKCHANYCLPFE